MKKMLLAVASAAACVVFVAAPGRADTVILSGPGNITGDENVLFNQTGLLATGKTVQGSTNQSHVVIDFLSTTSLATPSGGQARVAAGTGSYTDLAIIPHHAGDTMTSVMFNADAVANGTITITADPVGKTPVVHTFDLSKNGQNFFRIIESNGDTLSEVSFVTTAGVSDVSQTRIGVKPAAVPVPASALGGAAILGGLGLLKLRSRRLA